MPSLPSLPSRHRPALGHRELVVMMASLMALQALAVDMMLPALGALAADLGVASDNDRQLVIGAFMISSGVGALFPGVLADRFGRRPVLLTSLAVYIVLSLTCALATSFPALLAIRALQGLTTGAAVVMPMVIIRDNFSGDRMAKLTSLISIVFMIVPILAPSLGQLVLTFGNWRTIFAVLAGLATLLTAWVAWRLPETLHDAYHQAIDPGTIARNMGRALIRREAAGYALGSGLLMGAMLGYVMSSQQLIGEHFGAGENFPFIFGATATSIAAASFINSRIVERFGARRVSHAALLLFIGAASCQVVAALDDGLTLYGFLPFLVLNIGLVGFLGANFGSLAMAPFAETAGAASSTQAFVRQALGACVGIGIGAAYDNSPLPLALGYLLCGLAALGLVLFSERGKLFTRRYDPYVPPLG